MAVASKDLEVLVDLTYQVLRIVEGGTCTREYLVSTSRYGPGERFGSECTPRGKHIIRAKIGDGLLTAAVFDRRRPTGEVYTADLVRRFPDRDWVLTRILWLSGTEPGNNRLGMVDSMRRYIYIHGVPDSEPMGVPFSRGCIRMRNDAVIELFDTVSVGTVVDIQP